MGMGAKFLYYDLGDVHTWPYSDYLMRQCDVRQITGKVNSVRSFEIPVAFQKLQETSFERFGRESRAETGVAILTLQIIAPKCFPTS